LGVSVADGADAVHDAEIGRRTCRADRRVGVEHLERADRREDGWNAQALAHEAGGRVDFRDIDQDPGSKRDFVESVPIAAQGCF
jgi:hypothetical protein